jgi:glycosyltransferase involved in cell wall biosynthesis
VSEFVRDQLSSEYGFSRQRVIAIPNGVDAQRFKPDPEVRGRIREKWGVPLESFVFGSVGRLTHHKGVDIGLEAFARVVENSPRRPVFLVIVGEGDLREHLLRRARQLQISHRLILTGLVDNPAEAYQGFDAFVLPSRVEALSISLLEAMASGCEVIASRVGGIPEVVCDPELGMLVPPEDPIALADAMGRALVRADTERAVLGRTARRHVMAQYTLQKQCRDTVRLLA